VLSDVGGARDLIDHGQHGLIVPPDDVPALVAALQALADDPALALAMGRAARAKVQRDFSPESYVQQHEQLYESLAWAATATRGVTAR
jgi:glycosyltransferase involved in cell wall biosynthesis